VQVDVGVGTTLNVRPTPSTAMAPVGSLPHGAIADRLGEEIGENIDGEDLWYHIATDQLEGYVLSTFAMCTMEEPPDIDDPNGWYLPLTCGAAVTVSQGNNGGTSHSGTSAYAFDFAVPVGTQVVAIQSGTVTHVYGGTMPGDPCYNGGDDSCSGAANYVALLHNDGTKSVYLHLSQPQVSVGEVVARGAPVGLSGSTGWSTGRHLHVQRMNDCGSYYCQSIPLAFADVPGDGVPTSGQMVVSGNCP
jgi:murein DD-endopeptidase MepM/ murein hydrolase activator NlpD